MHEILNESHIMPRELEMSRSREVRLQSQGLLAHAPEMEPRKLLPHGPGGPSF